MRMPVGDGVMLGNGVNGLLEGEDEGDGDALGVGVAVGSGASLSADFATQSSHERVQSVQPLPCSSFRGLPVYSTGSPCFICPNR